MRESRPRHSELTAEQKLKSNARAYANTYFNRGKLKRQPCEVCGSEKTEKHHDDYNKPLEVRWFCRSHHLQHHKWVATMKRFHKEPTCSTNKVQPVYNQVLVDVDYEWKEEHVTPSGVIGIRWEAGGDELDRSLGSQTKGTIVELPRMVASNLRAILKHGDLIYFHYNSIVPDSRVQFDITKKPTYLVDMDAIFCIVRDGQIIMYNSRILVEPIFDKEIVDATIIGGRTKSGIITELHEEKHNLKKAILAHIGEPPIGSNPLKVAPGQVVYYEKDSDMEMEVEGKKYLCMVQDDLLMKEAI